MVILLGLIPSHIHMKKLDEEMLKLKQQVDEQQVLFPVFQSCLASAQIKEPDGMKLPEKKKFTREESGMILSLFQELALQNSIEVDKVLPDVDTMFNGSSSFMVDIALQGEFNDFRKLLLQLLNIPYLEHIERIEVFSVEGPLQFRLKVWLAQEEILG